MILMKKKVLGISALFGTGGTFDDKGRIVNKYRELLLVQCQKGIPRVIYPADLATAKAVWPTKK
jgi:hypothetical protein